MNQPSNDVKDLAINLLDDIYIAATEPYYWDTVVRKLVDITGASFASMGLRDIKTGDVVLSENSPFAPVLVNFEPEYIASYLAHFKHHDIWTPIERFADLTDIVRFGEHVPSNEFKSSLFYKGWLKPQGISDALAIELSEQSKGWVILNLHYGVKSSIEHKRIHTLCTILLPHLRRAFQITVRLSRLNIANNNLERLHDISCAGVILLNSTGVITYKNSTADSMLDLNDGLLLINGILKAEDQKINKQLQQLFIDASLSSAEHPFKPAGGFLSILRCSGKRPYQACITPLPQKQSQGVSKNAIAVFITDPEWVDLNFHRKISSLFGLTPAEASLVNALVDSYSLKEYAERQDISFNTVRWHLRNILAKTQTKSQAELMKVVLNTPTLFQENR